MSTTSPRRRPQVPAARNTLAILNMLAGIDVPVSAARISKELDLPRSTTYHLLAEMIESGFVVHLPENRTYGLGMTAYSMAQAYGRQQPLIRVADKPLQAAAAAVGGSGHMSRLSGDDIVYLLEVRAPGAVFLVTRVGVRLPVWTTASGRALLAQLPDVELKARLATSSCDETWKSFTQRMTQVRDRGWAEENQEVSPGQRSVAVAVLDHLDRPAAALAVTFPVGLSNPDAIVAATQQLQAGAQRISRTLYGRTDNP